MAIFGRNQRGRHAAGQVDNDDFDDDLPEEPIWPEEAEFETPESADSDAGPYDESEAPNDGVSRLNLGSVLLPVSEKVNLQIEVVNEPADGLYAVHLLTPHARLTVTAYAAPRSGGLWSEISRELTDQLHRDGARVHRERGKWGTELVALNNNVLMRFVGVDGPRWMLRAVAATSPKDAAQAAQELQDVVSKTVVVRGMRPVPAGMSLPVVLPDELATHIQQASGASS